LLWVCNKFKLSFYFLKKKKPRKKMRGTRGQQAKSSGEDESEEFNLAEIVQ
jgi:hypothetical protein